MGIYSENLIDSMGEAAVMYDEANLYDKLTIINGRRPVIHQRSSDCFAVTLIGKELRISIRGSDGSHIWQKAIVWIDNLLNSKPDKQGCHPGFKEAAEWILGWLVLSYRILDKDFDSVNVSCHSRGTGIGVNLLPILGEYLWSHEKRVPINMDAFAFVPGMNQFGIKNIWDAAYDKYGITARFVRNPRDIATTMRRGPGASQGADPYNGVNYIELPPDTWIQKVIKKIGGFHEHRPREYADGMILLFKGNQKLVGRIRKYRNMMVN
jgi:hypothetical protein